MCVNCVRQLSENILMVVDNILDVDVESIQQSQEESNASARYILHRVPDKIYTEFQRHDT